MSRFTTQIDQKETMLKLTNFTVANIFYTHTHTYIDIYLFIYLFIYVYKQGFIQL